MAHCSLCNDQEKKNEDDVRLAYDFTPTELIGSAFGNGCTSCAVIFGGIRRSETNTWSFAQDVRRGYARCRGMRNQKPETLSLELYFLDERPKLELEFFSLASNAWKAITPRPSISGHPFSPKALVWVRSQLEMCSAKHVSCRNSRLSQLPKRVALELSKITDRLPALSGLCERVSHLRDKYLAGIWADSIWHDLLWRVDAINYQLQHIRLSLLVRPYWTWISVERAVRYWDDIKSLSLGLPPALSKNESINDINVVALDVRCYRRRPLSFDCDIRLAGINPYGEVSTAILRVKSYSRTARLKYVHESQPRTAKSEDL